MTHFLEDFAEGQTYQTGRLLVDEQHVKKFAAEYDPQPFHLDGNAARSSVFGKLAASGWHTAAMTMRLVVDGDLKPAGGIIGMGVEELRWPTPVYPGDELRVESEILNVRPSKSRPTQGLVRVRNTTLNQNNQPVQINTVTLLVDRRPTQAIGK